ncbi:MAG: hypothetical protein M1825_000820 [Sarcosagium campestre]|nr:MAG: hypothetical protein M1825_000820 [Sarcosagium campestre]
MASVTRSHKLNDRDHVGLADGTAGPEEHLPRYFAKAGHVESDPKKTKKDGAGKGNWGRSGEEVEDYNYNLTNPRRRSNSSTHAPKDFKTKFEHIEQEPVFEEEIHGASLDDGVEDADKETTDSTSGASVEEDEHPKKV